MHLEHRILITGGAGFIGSALCRHLFSETDHEIVVVDKLTYAASRASLAPLEGSPRFRLVEADICDFELISALFEDVRSASQSRPVSAALMAGAFAEWRQRRCPARERGKPGSGSRERRVPD